VQRQRIRQLVSQIAGRQSLFRGVLRAQRRDLAELCALSGTDAADGCPQRSRQE
jgi:hypothetical protein